MQSLKKGVERRLYPVELNFNFLQQLKKRRNCFRFIASGLSLLKEN